MVNPGEASRNVVTKGKPKMLTGLVRRVTTDLIVAKGDWDLTIISGRVPQPTPKGDTKTAWHEKRGTG